MLLKKDNYVSMPHAEYVKILTKYSEFIEALNDVDKVPIKVFKPLPPILVDELKLVREVSKDLQKKKEEDMKRAAQAAKEAAEESVKKNEELPAIAQKDE